MLADFLVGAAWGRVIDTLLPGFIFWQWLIALVLIRVLSGRYFKRGTTQEKIDRENVRQFNLWRRKN